ncbi:MAG: alkaline phosphatase family protein [Verrucomicrobiaceae bacterium]|nr:alkaline phosphatase family protein [Verrucomicrobiaceae bacterium]
MRNWLLLPGTALAICAASVSCGRRGEEHRGTAKHVVLIVCDGMRGDFVREESCPNLWKLAQEGVTFRRHHSVYPSLTNVNGTVLATGVYPGRSGVIANREYRPRINPAGPVDAAVAETIGAGDEATGGRYLAASTVPEILQQAGRRTALAGTKWISVLFDRAVDRTGEQASRFPLVTSGKGRPPALHQSLVDSLGEFPARALPNQGQDEWTASALLDHLWRDGVPDFSLLWLSDPDYSEHDTAPGTPTALAAIRNSDAILGKLLAVLEEKQLRAATDIFVVSDHGFSTIERAHDLPAMLREAGFSAAKKFDGEPERGQILVAGNSGTTLFYVAGRDEGTTARLVEWLQQSDFAGVIFTRQKFDGTFAMDEAHLAKEDGPDVIMSFRWNDATNSFGVPGRIMSDWNRPAGQGTHGTLSRFDLHNMLIAAGPDFRRGHTSEVPSANLDVAPTILHIFGITPRAPLDGRVLHEAMTSGRAQDPEVRVERREARRSFGPASWEQYLQLSRVGEHVYIDEGNGAFLPASNR